MKINLPRDFYKPQNAVEIKSPDCTAVAYLGTSKHSGKLCAVGFSGKRNKPDFNYSFRDEDQARKYIAEHSAGVLAGEKRRKEWATQRNAEICRTPLEVWTKAQSKGSISSRDAAVCLRAVLAREFPSIKFSVRSDSSLNIEWTDGPSYKAVNKIAQNYSFEGFDGMVDCRYQVQNWLSRDGRMTLAHSPNNAGGYSDGESIGSPHSSDCVLVRNGPDFVFCRREMSFGEELKLAQSVAKQHGIALPEFATQRDLRNFTRNNREAGEYLSMLMYREQMQEVA
jgi:hypothetical protein